jgi:hypothetical protein
VAWAFVQTLTDTTWDEYEQVNERLGDEPPEGLIVHAAGLHEGRVRIMDVWESEEAHNRFRDERLMPAVTQVVGEERVAQGPGEFETLEVRDLIKSY